MQTTIDRLQYEIRTAKETAAWCADQIAHFEEQRRLAHRTAWKKKLELRQLTTKADASN